MCIQGREEGKNLTQPTGQTQGQEEGWWLKATEGQMGSSAGNDQSESVPWLSSWAPSPHSRQQ